MADTVVKSFRLLQVHKNSSGQSWQTQKGQEHRLRDTVIAGMKQDQQYQKGEILGNITHDFKHGGNRVDT